jgi:uncharacterized protein YkwD
VSLPTLTRRSLARLTTSAIGAVFAASLAVTVAPAAPAFADTASMEAQFVSLMNSARQSAGLRPYTVSSDLVSVARAHSAQMAQKQTLYHNPNLTTDVKNWQAVGENVGEGPTVSDIHNAFMNSPEHRANILDHDFTQVGVGVAVDSNGIIWVTEDFRQPTTTASAPAPAPAPAPVHTTAPAPAPVTTTAASRPYSSTVPAVAAAPAQTVAHRPSAAQLARQQLADRLHKMGAAHRSAADPLAQALLFERTLTALTG